MRVRWFVVLSCLFAAFALGLAACGDDDDDGGGGGDGGGGAAAGDTVNVYSSLPLQGASRPQTTAMVQGIELALKQRNGKAGDFTVKYESLDDSTASEGSWTPEATSANARKVAQDDKAVAYIGEFNSGASAVSIPILNEAGVPQVSPANTYVGLTTDLPGSEEGEPDKFYPTGKRTYSRIVPIDSIQAAALVTLMKSEGCKNVYILNDKETYGAGLARNLETAAKEQQVEVLGNDGIDPKAANFRSVASKMKSAGAECFVYSGITANGAVQLFKDVAAALPDAKLYGPDGVAESGFADPKEGGIPEEVGKRIKVSVATLSPDEYPPEGQKFFKDFEAEYGEKNPDPYSIYGYEAMNLVLDAIEKGGGTKEGVLEQIFSTKGRQSVLGTYDIDENGDTTLTDYGIYAIEGGELKFDQTIKAEG